MNEILKGWREDRDLTQSDVAKALGVSVQTVCKWETQRCDPKASSIVALAKLYGLDAGDVFNAFVTRTPSDFVARKERDVQLAKLASNMNKALTLLVTEYVERKHKIIRGS